MPNTSNYGFDYESPTSLPGTTLTGGPTTTMPILAVQVDAALAALASTVSDQASLISALQASVTANQTSITNLTNWSKTGTTTMTFAVQVSSQQAVVFPSAFPGIPKVNTNIVGTSGTSLWASRAINITATGFDMFVFRTNNTTGSWTDVPVDYVATYRP